MDQQLYPPPSRPEPTLPDPARHSDTADTGPAAALAAILWVVFLATTAVAPAIVIATWRVLL